MEWGEDTNVNVNVNPLPTKEEEQSDKFTLYQTICAGKVRRIRAGRTLPGTYIVVVH